ncbi:unnamed protein product [Caretta caretta]
MEERWSYGAALRKGHLASSSSLSQRRWLTCLRAAWSKAELHRAGSRTHPFLAWTGASMMRHGAVGGSRWPNLNHVSDAAALPTGSGGPDAATLSFASVLLFALLPQATSGLP